MKQVLLFSIICLTLISCGRRGALEPFDKEANPYPRQYPHAESQQ